MTVWPPRAARMSSVKFKGCNMAKSKSPKTKVEEFSVELTLDMGQAEKLIREMAEAYGWDQVEDIFRRLRKDSEEAKKQG